MQQLKWGFKRTINWNKYQSKLKIQGPNEYLNYLVDLSFQGVNRLFVLSFENNTDRRVHTKYYLPILETQDYNVMIDRKKPFTSTIKNILKTFDNILPKIRASQGDNYTSGCLVDHSYFIKYDKIIITCCWSTRNTGN